MTAPALRQRMLLPLLLGGAGFALNLLRFEIFFNVDFIFGSAFVMLAILAGGPLVGVAAGLLAGSATLLLWSHPWGLVILGAEAAAVGWLAARRGWDLLLADLLFWIVLGAPLVWSFYHLLLGMDPQATLLVILKQAVNGVVNTLAASLVHKLWHARIRPTAAKRPAFRPLVFVTLVSLVTFPALVFLVAFLRREIHHEEQVLVDRSLELGRVSRQALETWIVDHHQAIQTLAALEGRTDLDAAERQRAVDILRTASPAFQRIGVLDARSIVTAYSPPLDAQGRRVVGQDFSDRPYLPVLTRTLRPYVADLGLSRVGPPRPVFPMLAPILQEGRFAGYCIGVTDLAVLQGLLRSLAGADGAQVTLWDRNGQVVSSTRDDLPPLTPYRPLAGEVRGLGLGVVQRIPPSLPGHSRMQRWTHSLVTHADVLSPDLPWTVVVELPFAPTVDLLTRISILGLGALMVVILGTVALAQALSQGITRTIARLEAATRAFPALLAAGPERRLDLPASGIEELQRLAEHFGQMAGALRFSFRELEELRDGLEARVALRTAELQAALDTIKTLQGIIPICASCKKIRDDKGAWNQLETYISEHTEAAFSHGLCPDCAQRFREEARIARAGE